MCKVPYTKPALSYTEQLQQLKERGMLVRDDAKALFLLENISYYRLSGYWYPLLIDKQNHCFKPDAELETAFMIYCFDKELRKLFLSELEKIEVAIRAKMIYIMSHAHGSFWYLNTNLFKNPGIHAKSLSKISEEYIRSDEEFILAFKAKYSDPLPPSWMMMEIASFGTLSIIYSQLKPGRNKRDIANHFGLSDSVFSSWLHSIVYLRNVCAHHTRLWNRVMSIRPQLPDSPAYAWLTSRVVNNRTYFMACMIRYFLFTVNPTSSFITKLQKIFDKYPNIDIQALGFPLNWKVEPLWQK